jgi:ribosomal protein S18 acetylase RimI-like enzyme
LHLTNHDFSYACDFNLPTCPDLLPQVLGCAVIRDLGHAADGVRVAELGAFVVHKAYRRAGFGDSLLDYVEQVGGWVGGWVVVGG